MRAMHSTFFGSRTQDLVFFVCLSMFTISAQLVCAATEMVTKRKAKDILATLGFYEGQRLSVEAAMKKFPGLRGHLALANMHFDEAFLPSIRELERLMETADDPEWKKTRQQIFEASDIDPNKINRDDAEKMIGIVESRAEGEIPPPIIDILLEYHPAYRKSPAAEYLDGFKQEYISDGTGKAIGLKIAIEYPMSWSNKPGRRPHIVQLFQSADKQAMVLITVEKLTWKARIYGQEQLLKHLTSKKCVETELPDAVFLTNGSATVAGRSSTMCDHRARREVPKGHINMKFRTYYFIFEKRLVSAQFAIGGFELPDDLIDKRFAKYEPLFDQIVVSIDIYNRYE